MRFRLAPRSFKFHKGVRQQNSGAAEDFILPYSAVYLRIQRPKTDPCCHGNKNWEF